MLDGRRGKWTEEHRAPRLVILSQPPRQDERVDDVRVAVEELTHHVGLAHDEACEVERIDGVARHSLAHPRRQLLQGRELQAFTVGQIGGERRHASRRRDDADATYGRVPVRRELGEELGTIEELVDVARRHDPVLGEGELVHPAVPGDGSCVGLHDLPCAVTAAEFEGEHGDARTAGAGYCGEEGGRTADGLDDEADHGRGRVVDECLDVVGQVTDGLVARRDRDGDAQSALVSCCQSRTHEEPALRHDGDSTRWGVDPSSREEVHAKWHILEPTAVGTDHGQSRLACDLPDPVLERRAGITHF